MRSLRRSTYRSVVRSTTRTLLARCFGALIAFTSRSKLSMRALTSDASDGEGVESTSKTLLCVATFSVCPEPKTGSA